MNAQTPWLVVGLGNPGAEYAQTRHNVGYLVLDVLLGRASATLTRHRTGTRVADVRLGTLPGGAPGPRAVLAICESYMNTSGGPVGRLMSFLKIGPENLLVVHDDLDLPSHELRLKNGGGEGGHNGLKSISQVLGTKNYHRLRVGIGRPPGRQDPADYVLSRFAAQERPEWDVTCEKAADVVEDILVHGFSQTQQSVHSKKSGH